MRLITPGAPARASDDAACREEVAAGPLQTLALAGERRKDLVLQRVADPHAPVLPAVDAADLALHVADAAGAARDTLAGTTIADVVEREDRGAGAAMYYV